MAYINGEEILFSSTVNIGEGGGVSSEEITNLQNQINSLTEKHDNEVQTLTDKDADLQTQINNLGSGGGASVITETFSTFSEFYTKLCSISPEKLLNLKLNSSSSISCEYTGICITTSGVTEVSDTSTLLSSSFTFLFKPQAVAGGNTFYFICHRNKSEGMFMQVNSSNCTIQASESEYKTSQATLYTGTLSLVDYIDDGVITISLSYFE